jgi:20S proteasome alpha/beta subunit
MYGTYLEYKRVCTGFAGYFSNSLISNYWREDCSEEEAK